MSNDSPISALSLKELEAQCLKTMAPMVRDYLYDGAEECQTIRENLEVWDRWLVIPRMMRNTSVTYLSPKNPQFGQQWSIPVGIAPSAMQQLAHSSGEKATAAAAMKAGIPFGLSTFSNYSIEEVKEAGGDSVVALQMYFLEGRRDLNLELVRRAEAAGYKAIVLTVDSPIPGNRHGLIKSKFVMPKDIKFRNFCEDFTGPLDQSAQSTPPPQSQPPSTKVSDISEALETLEVSKPRKPREASIANLESESSQAPDGSTAPQPRNQLRVDPSINWERDMRWLRENTTLEIWVKGILHPQDAETAVLHGAKGIIVSNHGGRQLDGCISALDALPGVVKAVGGRVPVHVDGGVRRGADIFKALALGAEFVWIGRPIWWGLHANGQEGVEWVVETLVKEFRIVMMLMGCVSVEDIVRKMILPKNSLPSMGGGEIW
ncbi:hypothetical protein ABW20_dc0107655 [Dactylellina cionopaga]|nr:hypothetical protein ABW20_dc0107655 [Dactylellina cionopaga]